jgi:hypothetical protein
MLSSDNRTQRLFQFHTVFKLQPLKKPNKIITGNIPAITGNLQRSNFVIRNNGENSLSPSLSLYTKKGFVRFSIPIFVGLPCPE